ncbi:MAG TPA: hypothetical protein VL096_05295, partial [Pirellulaceae bacterium]|nr:hypothetical protein [Pirellulaceae bacterium]
RLPQVAGDLAEKQCQIALKLPKGERRSRHLAITRLNARLSDHLVETRLRLREEYELATSQWQQAQLLGSREFAFCLFPEASLRSQLLDLSQLPL